MTSLEFGNVSQNIRPIKIGFLVNSRKYDSVFEAVMYNSMLWGGKYNIIIPIWTKSFSKAKKKPMLDLLATNSPDYIVNLTNKDFPKEVREKYDDKFLLTKHKFVSKKKEDYEFSLGLRIYPILNSFLNDIKKNRLEKIDQNLMNFGGNLKENLDIVINTGYLGKSGLSDCINGIEGTEIFSDRKDFIKKHTTHIDVLSIGGYLLNSRGGIRERDIIFVGRKNSLSDMINFWNIIACGSDGIFISFEDIHIYKKLINTYVSNNYYKINNNGVHNTTTFVKGDSITPTELSDNITNLVYKKNNGKFSIMNRVPRFSDSGSPYVMKEIISSDVFHENSRKQFIVNKGHSEPIEFIRPFFLGKLPYRYEKPYYAIDIGLSSYGHGRDTFNVPMDKSLKKFIKYRIFHGEDGLNISDKISMFIDWPESNNFNVSKVKPYSIFEEYFNHYGLEISYSEPGIISERIIEHLGGNIDNCRILKLKSVRDLLRNMSTRLGKEGSTERKQSNKKIREGMEIPNIVNYIKDINSSSEDFSAIFRADKYGKQELGVVKYLYEKNIIRPGLNLECENCSKKEWYGIEEFQKDFQCRYCFKNQQVILFKGKQQSLWSYKPDGLFILPDGGQGSIATIISIWFLDHFNFSGARDNFIYLSSIDCKDGNGKKYECDFVGFLGNTLILGEAKNYTELTKKDFDQMLGLGKSFDTKPVLCFSILREEFTEKEKRMIKKIQEKGFGVLPLTRLDLDPYDLHDRFSSLKNRYPFTIDELIKNICELNLN